MSYHHGDLKSAILDAAECCLAEKSLYALSMRELARKAGVSSGAPYHHFSDRSGLVEALCRRGFSRLGKALNSSRERDGIKGMAKAYLKFAKENVALYQLMFSAEATQGDVAESLRRDAGPVFGLLDEELSASDTDSLAPVAIWCFMHGLVTLSESAPLRERLGRKSLNTFAHETTKKLARK